MEADNPIHPIDLSLFKDHIKNSFFSLIDQTTKGVKTLVIEKSVINLLDFFLDLKLLKEKEISSLMTLCKSVIHLN